MKRYFVIKKVLQQGDKKIVIIPKDSKFKVGDYVIVVETSINNMGVQVE